MPLDVDTVDALIREGGLHWMREGLALVKTRRCRNVASATEYVDAINRVAHAMRHYPRIEVQDTEVTLTISTPPGEITDLDLALALQIDHVQY